MISLFDLPDTVIDLILVSYLHPDIPKIFKTLRNNNKKNKKKNNLIRYSVLSIIDCLHILGTNKLKNNNSKKKDLYIKCCEYGALRSLEWVITNDYGCYEWNIFICSTAAKAGHLHIIQWARSNGCKWNAFTCSNAAESGHLEILKWAHENGCPWNAWTCSKAAENGHLEVLKWAHENGCPWDTHTCSSAALGGHLNILQWARSENCPWNSWTLTKASDGGNTEIRRWAESNGCPRKYNDIDFIMAMMNFDENFYLEEVMYDNLFDNEYSDSDSEWVTDDSEHLSID